MEYFRNFKLVLYCKLIGWNKNPSGKCVSDSGDYNIVKESSEENGCKTRNMLTVQKTFHPNSDTDSQYLSKRKDERSLISSYGCIEEVLTGLGWNIKYTVEAPLKHTKKIGFIKDDTKENI